MKRLAKASRRRARLTKQLELANNDVLLLSLEAVRDGYPQSKVAEVAGVPRMTVHRWVRDWELFDET